MIKLANTDVGLLRKFGLLVGGIFVGLGCLPVILHQDPPAIWALVVGSVLVGIAAVYPQGLKPIYQVWMKVGSGLGWINTRIILMLGFYLIFTPIGLVMRLFGNDPIARKFEPVKVTYRVSRTPRAGVHMQKQF